MQKITKQSKRWAFLSGHGFFRVARLQIARHHSNVCGVAYLVATEYSLKYDRVLAMKFGAKKKSILCDKANFELRNIFSFTLSNLWL